MLVDFALVCIDRATQHFVLCHSTAQRRRFQHCERARQVAHTLLAARFRVAALLNPSQPVQVLDCARVGQAKREELLALGVKPLADFKDGWGTATLMELQ